MPCRFPSRHKCITFWCFQIFVASVLDLYVLYIFLPKAPSMDVKNMWVSEIRKVLTGQLEACRGTFTHQQRLTLNVSVLLCFLDLIYTTSKHLFLKKILTGSFVEQSRETFLQIIPVSYQTFFKSQYLD